MATRASRARHDRRDGNAFPFNRDWRFLKGDHGASAVEFDDSGWRQIDLPHDWSIEGPFDKSLTSATAYLPGGIGWYRRRFGLAEVGYAPGNRARIRFDGIYNNSTVWCNGMLLGTRPYGYSSFSYDITDCIDQDRADQVIAVRADHSRFSDSRWYTGSGIYRDVRLLVSNPVHLREDGVFVHTPSVTQAQAVIRVETTIANEDVADHRVVLTSIVVDRWGREVAKVSTRRSVELGTDAVFVQTVAVRQPELWSPESPALYAVRTLLSDEEAVDPPAGVAVHDSLTTSFGIRTFAFDPRRGFTLNGVSTKLKGVCIHHDGGCFGSAVPKEVWDRRLRILKASGCNAIRFSHNPPAPELLDLCDTLGFLAMDEAFDEWEASKNKWVVGHNQGAPSREGYADHFAEWGETDLTAMVVRDRNHPSIVFWSIGNEIDYPNDPYTHPVLGDRYDPDRPHSDRLGVVAGRLASVVRALDPTRPVTAALADVTVSNRTGFADALDVVGYNYLERHYESDHASYPHRVIYGSENGQSREAWEAVRNHDYICGQFLWTGIDFLGEARGWPVRNSQAGFLDTAGFRKPTFYFRQSLWCEAPMAWLGVLPPGTQREPRQRRGWGEVPSWTWPGHEGELITVVCHTNCDFVELLRDGETQGARTLEDAPDGLISWTIPYRAGSLSVKGYRGGAVAVTGELRTAGPASRVVAVYGTDAYCERSFLRADGEDVIHAELTIVDAARVPVYDACHCLEITADGPAAVIGLENGDPASHEPYGTRRRSAYHGKLLVVLRSTGGAGTATVTATGEGLEACRFKIRCV